MVGIGGGKISFVYNRLSKLRKERKCGISYVCWAMNYLKSLHLKAVVAHESTGGQWMYKGIWLYFPTSSAAMTDIPLWQIINCSLGWETKSTNLVDLFVIWRTCITRALLLSLGHFCNFFISQGWFPSLNSGIHSNGKNVLNKNKKCQNAAQLYTFC